jgi:hypothetical protein
MSPEGGTVAQYAENPMHPITLRKARDAWNRPEFAHVLKDEIENLDPALLPLQQGLSQGSYASPEGLAVMILRIAEDSATIRVTTGIHFTGIVAGCACADDPTPDGEYAEYCEVLFEIDRRTARTTVTLLKE